tara:strand:+ start:75 stop:1133 length:1059 start_codon:yes stop_codon:yes gene_type:complete
MKKNILLIGIIWTILTVLCMAIISGYDPIESSVSEYQNTIYALIVFQFIPSIFLAAYYLKTKSVQKISYVILGLIYTWSFVILLSMSVNEEGIVFLIILLLIPIIGSIIWIKRKQSRHTVTKNNHIKNKTKTEKNNSYDQLKKEISEYQLKNEMGEYHLKKEIDEYENKNKKTVSEETVSDKIEDTQKSISELIKSSESETLEFKSTLKWDIRENRANSSLVFGCVKTIAGFLNNKGGILIIGYDDDNEVVHGLEKDYPHMGQKRCNYDGWQQYFISQINDTLGKTINRYFTIEPIPYNGKTLAKIRVQSSPEPVFTKHDNTEGNFFVRIHGQTEKLNPQETQKWILENFKK